MSAIVFIVDWFDIQSVERLLLAIGAPSGDRSRTLMMAWCATEIIIATSCVRRRDNDTRNRARAIDSQFQKRWLACSGSRDGYPLCSLAAMGIDTSAI
ncbi:hypothetical protein LOC71_04880 [Rhodopirellula sp. JC740]|uniref:Uncharacterized protein n=1 Tax=Rhodopirellula halodulae TaxID=2894198 RepID=A0ABS8NDI1_9BACT|nr:hypothetical protein [Rhodopirellula sp. JC740]MCC9641598.1 hypothetical protein [Rhodopirellula sp. JC740]